MWTSVLGDPPVEAGGCDGCAVVLGAPLAVPRGRGQRAHGILGHRVDGDGPGGPSRAGDGCVAVVDAPHPEEGRRDRLVRGRGGLAHRCRDVLVAGDEGRDEAREHRVDLGVGERRLERAAELLGGGLGRQVHRSVRDREAPARARVRGERAQGRRVGHDGDPVPRRQGLVDDELGDVEELVDVLHPDDARLLEHGLEHLGPRLRASHAVPGGTPKRDTPDFTTMTGLMRARLRATRENLRGLPIDSR